MFVVVKNNNQHFFSKRIRDILQDRRFYCNFYWPRQISFLPCGKKRKDFSITNNFKLEITKLRPTDMKSHTSKLIWTASNSRYHYPRSQSKKKKEKKKNLGTLISSLETVKRLIFIKSLLRGVALLRRRIVDHFYKLSPESFLRGVAAGSTSE